MPSKIYSCALEGIEAHGVEIEVDICRGLSRFMVVGLGDKAVQESKERVRSALVNSGFEFPRQRKVVNLAPADLKKCGPSFDLPIAIGLLLESEQVRVGPPSTALLLGELALDGSLRSTEGVLSTALFAERHGFESLFVPRANVKEASLVSNVRVFPVTSLAELVNHFSEKQKIAPLEKTEWSFEKSTGPLPPTAFSAPPKAWKALALAAAGGHHLLFSGPPGSGKTLLSTYFPHLLPPLSYAECIELTQIYSAAGLLPFDRPLLTTRPFRSVHHTASVISLVGGGSIIRPGEISLAHRGVLFLDEVAEFPRASLETLRQPLEERRITVSRASGSSTFPAHFTLIAAMNPCPCGYVGDPYQRCGCTVRERLAYQQKLSGPFLDRIDLFVAMPRLSFEDLSAPDPNFSLSTLKEGIERALVMQRERFSSSLRLNADLTPDELSRCCALDPLSETILCRMVNGGVLTARGYSRVLKVARTLADMEGCERIQQIHLEQALDYRKVSARESV